MGLPIAHFRPGAIRTLFNTKVRNDAMSVYALEFHTAWIEDTLFVGAFPQGSIEGPLDEVFEQYGGQLDPPTPDWKATLLRYYSRKDTTRPAAEDLVKMREKP